MKKDKTMMIYTGPDGTLPGIGSISAGETYPIDDHKVNELSRDRYWAIAPPKEKKPKPVSNTTPSPNSQQKGKDKKK